MACLLIAMSGALPAAADEAAASQPGEGGGRVIDYDGKAPRDEGAAAPPPPVSAGTRRVELITGGNSTDGAAKVGVLPVQE